jgi:lysophospholipase L1-like esterase
MNLRHLLAIALLGAGLAQPPAAAPSLELMTRADGLLEVRGAPAGTVVRYTLDGSDPTREAGVWLAPVDLPPGYTVKARAFTGSHEPVGGIVSRSAAASGARRSSTLVPVTQNRDWRVYDWAERHAAILALNRTRQPEIVMVGDSITHFWGGDPPSGRRTGAAVWDRVFAGRRVVNLGYGWDRTENVLWRLAHGEIDGIAPGVAVVMIGTNNVGINTPDEIAAGVEAICAAIHRTLPSTRILLLGIFPRGERPNEDRVTLAAVNARIARLDGRSNVTFLDLGGRFLEPDGRITTEIMYDFLHPTARGYEIWAEAMAPLLTKLLGDLRR